MNNRFLYLIVIIACTFTVFSCSLKTPTANEIATVKVPGKDLVISEVFHIAPEQQYAYSWIELFNPTNKNLYWYKEDILNDSMKVTKYVLVSFLAKVRFYVPGNPSYITFTDTVPAYFSNYQQLAIQNNGTFGPGFYDPDENLILPGTFTVIVNNLDRLNRHNTEPPNDPVVIEPTLPFSSDQGTVQPSVVLYFTNPFNPSDTAHYYLGANAFWDLLDENEISLIRLVDTVNTRTDVHNKHTEILDVVRYGGYRPTPDPYPSNAPLPHVPEGSSVARYGGYYGSGSTADNFYVSSKPIPGWYSQIGK